MMRTLVVVLSLAGCTGTVALKTAGESCVTSSECGPALLCDDVSHECQGMGTIDADVPKVDAPKNYDSVTVIPADAPPD